MSRLSDYVKQAAGIPEAPNDGTTYGRRGSDTSWQPVYRQDEADSEFAAMVHTHPYVGLTGDESVDGEKTFVQSSAFAGAAIDPAYGLNVGGSINVGAGQNFFINGIPIETFTDAPADSKIYGRSNNAWVEITAGGGGTITNLSTDYFSTYVTVVNSGGQDTNINAATAALAGLMTAADKVKLDAAVESVDLANTRDSTSVTITNTAGNNTTLAAATTGLAGVLTAADKSKLNSALEDVDLGATQGSTSVTVTNTGGIDAVLPAATTSLAGVMTAADKLALQGLQITTGTYNSFWRDVTANETSRAGTWVRVGPLVFFQFYFYWTTINELDSSATKMALPFTVSSGSDTPTAAVGIENIDFGGTTDNAPVHLFGRGVQGEASMGIWLCASRGAGTLGGDVNWLTYEQFREPGSIVGSIMYITDDP